MACTSLSGIAPYVPTDSKTKINFIRVLDTLVLKQKPLCATSRILRTPSTEKEGISHLPFFMLTASTGRIPGRARNSAGLLAPCAIFFCDARAPYYLYGLLHFSKRNYTWHSRAASIERKCSKCLENRGQDGTIQSIRNSEL